MVKSSNQYVKLLNHINPWMLVTFTRDIARLVGIKFTLMLSSNYYITKGFAHSLIRGVPSPWFQKGGMESQVADLNQVIGMMPWSMKGFFGVISDNLAIGGYYKRYYLYIWTILGTIASTVLIAVPDKYLFATPQIIGYLLFVIHCQASSGDLFCQGKYVEKMKQFPESKGDLVTYVWFCQTFGGVWPVFFIGPAADAFNVKWLLIPMPIFVLQMYFFLYFGCLVDDVAPQNKRNRWDTEKFTSKWKYFVIGLVMGIGAVTVSSLAFFSFSVQALASVIAAIIPSILLFLWLPKLIAGAVFYKFCTTAFNIGDGLTVRYWATNDEDCVPGGPHFSFTFYDTYSGIAATIFQFSGLWFFQKFVSHLHLRTMLWLTNILYISSALVSLLIFTRTNLAIGISDHVFWLVSGAVLEPVFYMMNFMAGTLLIAKLCPKDIEVTVYAIFAGFSNFGQQVAAYLGIFLSSAMDIKTTTPCNWDNFVFFNVARNLLPLLEIPLTFLLIPKGRLEDDFLNESNTKILEVKVDNTSETK